MGKTTNFDPEKAAEQRKAEMKDITEKLEKGVQDVFGSEQFQNLLDTMAKFPHYSVNNNILIMMQKPDATLVQSYTGWKKMGRFVKKGEKGIRILAPAPFKLEKEQEKLDEAGKVILDKDGEAVKEKVEINLTAFKPVSTFDISQTEGEPLPSIGVDELTGSVEGYQTFFEAIKAASPVPIGFEDIKSGAKGYFHVEDNRIAINNGMSEIQTVKTAIHEMAHAKLHNLEAQKDNKQSKNSKEVEAESVAYTVCQHYGIDTSDYSFAYVAFDEVAGINFKDKDGIQIMKDYMASGSFARGKEEKAASASMVFVGNINQSVDVLLKTSSLFDPFPPEMGTDTAFLDRMHCYNPGWEIPKFRPEHFTDDYGFITDYLAGFIRELRKEQFGDAIDKYFRLGKNLNQRDTIAVRRMVDGYLKLLYPDGNFTKEDVTEVLEIALEMRRRVKEQLKKLGGMEFYDVNFSYIDMDDMSEHYVSVPEQEGGKLIPEGMCNPGQVYTVSHGKSDMIGVFRLESQMLPGNGKFDRTGLGTDRECKEAVDTAFNFLKANGNRISGSLGVLNKDFVINYQDLQGIGMTHKLALPTLIALCSIGLGRPVQSSMVVIGDFSIGGTIMKAENLASTLQVCLDSGAKKVLLPQTSAVDLGTVPAELMSSFSLVFYQSAEDAVFKALGVE